MALLGADPGGEPWFSRTAAQMQAENIFIDQNVVSNSNVAPAGRATTYGYKLNGNGVYFAKGNFGNKGTLTVGWANYNSSSGWANNHEIFTFTDGTTHQIEIRQDATGHLFLTRNGTAVGSASSNTITTGWHYYEITCVFATGATGSVLVKVDGVTFLNVTSVQTSATANAYANRFYLEPVVNNTDQWYKDIYWRDDSTMHGDLTVNVVYPTAAGPSQAWTASSGSQVSCVQDGITHTGTWPDDTTYISDATSGDISDFSPQSITLPGGGSILGAVHVSRLSKEVGSAVSLQQYTKSGGTTHTSASVTLGTSPSYFFDVLETDPNTGSAWTVTNLNNATHGVKTP